MQIWVYKELKALNHVGGPLAYYLLHNLYYVK